MTILALDLLHSGVQLSMVCAVIGLVFASSFSAPPLDRAEAKAKLEATQQVSALRHAAPLLSQEELVKGFKEGLWNAEKTGSVSLTGLTPKGAEVFEVSNPDHFLKLKTTIDVTLEITGIKDDALASNVKHVEFKWTNQATGIARQFLREGGDGTADFQMYDDGWRVIHLRLSPSNTRMSLTAAEQAAIDEALANAPEPLTIHSANPYFTTTRNFDGSQPAYPTGTWSNVPGVVVSPYPPHNLIRVDKSSPGTLVQDPTTSGIFRLP